MNIKEEVRRRIADLTQLAYERGYRDGAQSALAEIERIATDDVVTELSTVTTPLAVLPQPKARKKTSAKAGRRRVAKGASKAKRTANGSKGAKPKTVIVQEALQSLLSANGEARRDEVLAAAQASNPAITKFDLNNGLRVLLKQSKVQVSPENNKVLLPM